MGLHKGMNEQWESIENSFKKFDGEGHLGPFSGGDAIFYVIYIIYLKEAIYKIQHTIYHPYQFSENYRQPYTMPSTVKLQVPSISLKVRVSD